MRPDVDTIAIKFDHVSEITTLKTAIDVIEVLFPGHDISRQLPVADLVKVIEGLEKDFADLRITHSLRLNKQQIEIARLVLHAFSQTTEDQLAAQQAREMISDMDRIGEETGWYVAEPQN